MYFLIRSSCAVLGLLCVSTPVSKDTTLAFFLLSIYLSISDRLFPPCTDAGGTAAVHLAVLTKLWCSVG